MYTYCALFSTVMMVVVMVMIVHRIAFSIHSLQLTDECDDDDDDFYDD